MFLPRSPKDLHELRAAAEAANKEGRSKGKKFPYGGDVPPPSRDWRAEGKITPVKDQ